MHDGLLLPQLFRRHGLRTDIADLTHLATCRMYHNASEVWRGLAKNATEGMAAPARILPFTFLLFCGQILPLLLALSLLVAPAAYSGRWTLAHTGRPGRVVCAPPAFRLEISPAPAQRLACIRWASLYCLRFSGMPCCASLPANKSPGKSAPIAWGKTCGNRSSHESISILMR